MKKTLFAILVLTLTSGVFAEVVPKHGTDSIITVRESDSIGYRYCPLGKACTQIGSKAFYSIKSLKKREQREKREALLTVFMAPFLTLGATAFGVAIGPQVPYLPLLTGAVGMCGAIMINGEEEKDVDVLMIEEGSNMIVKDDKALLKMRNRLETLLKHVE